MAEFDNIDVVVINGVKYRRKLRDYTLQLVRSAVVLAVFSGSIQIDPGTPFFLTSLHAADTADTKVLSTQEAWYTQCQDNEGGYLWCDGPVERSSMFADRILGYQLPQPMPIRTNTRMTWTIINAAAGAGAGTATIVLRGYSLIAM